MRKYVLAIGIFALSFPAFAQDMEFGFGPGGPWMGEGHHWGWGHHHEHWGGHHYGNRGMCGELRRACMYKQELGEEGMGNCRRYREMCR